MTTFYYYIHAWPTVDVSSLERNHCFKFEYGRDVDPTDDWDVESLAESCSDDYYSNHDGWEHKNWPNDSLPIFLYDSKMNPIGAFDVYLEYEPSFSASRRK